MIEFPEGYFVAEERDDFFVSETMKRYWACCMEIVNIIDQVCQKYGIVYYADWGTLLGAVRHNGFIPWDDDMDIALKRPDYERLLKVLPGELPEGYKLSTAFNNPNHRQFFSGVSNGIEINLSKEHLEQFHQCPFVATIDIFPLDYIPRDEQERQGVKSIFLMIWQAIELIINGADSLQIERAVQYVEEVLDIQIVRNEYMRSQLWAVANQLAMSYGEEDGDELTFWCNYINKGKKYNKKWYDEIIYLPFETIQMPVPKHYDEVLTTMYGNWHIPVRGTQVHEYPCFKKQLEFLKRKLKEMKEEQGADSEVRG